MCEGNGSAASGRGFSRRRLLFLGASVGLLPISPACAYPRDNKTAATASTSPASTNSNSPVKPPVATSAEVPVPVTALPPAYPTPLLCRDSWGAAPLRPGGRSHMLDQMTLHHSAATLSDNREMPSHLRQHQRFHQDDRGWIDIAYHIAVDRRGNLYELRPVELAGDSATAYDPTGHFLVVVEGNFDEEQVTPEQLDGAVLAFAWAAQKYGLPVKVRGHRDVTATTACPGANLEIFVTNGELDRRIEALIARGPVELIPTCGPEADSIVAQIEAGY